MKVVHQDESSDEAWYPNTKAKACKIPDQRSIVTATPNLALGRLRLSSSLVHHDQTHSYSHHDNLDAAHKMSHIPR